jgi:hypothetical protein
MLVIGHQLSIQATMLEDSSTVYQVGKLACKGGQPGGSWGGKRTFLEGDGGGEKTGGEMGRNRGFASQFLGKKKA